MSDENTNAPDTRYASYSSQFIVQPTNPSLGHFQTLRTPLTDTQRHTEGIILAKARQESLDAELLARISWCESRYQMKWNYLHDTNPDYYTAYGVFQIVRGHEATYGISRMDLEGNIDLAIEIYKAEGTSPWNLSKGCWE